MIGYYEINQEQDSWLEEENKRKDGEFSPSPYG